MQPCLRMLKKLISKRNRFLGCAADIEIVLAGRFVRRNYNLISACIYVCWILPAIDCALLEAFIRQLQAVSYSSVLPETDGP